MAYADRFRRHSLILEFIDNVARESGCDATVKFRLESPFYISVKYLKGETLMNCFIPPCLNNNLYNKRRRL